MKKYFNITKRTFFTFFGLGILVFLFDMLIQHYWIDFVRVILGKPNLGWDFQPAIFKHIQSIFAYSPWIVLAVIFVKDILRKNFSRTISFFTGLAVTHLTLLYYILFNWVDIG